MKLPRPAEGIKVFEDGPHLDAEIYGWLRRNGRLEVARDRVAASGLPVSWLVFWDTDTWNRRLAQAS